MVLSNELPLVVSLPLVLRLLVALAGGAGARCDSEARGPGPIGGRSLLSGVKLPEGSSGNSLRLWRGGTDADLMGLLARPLHPLTRCVERREPLFRVLQVAP